MPRSVQFRLGLAVAMVFLGVAGVSAFLPRSPSEVFEPLPATATAVPGPANALLQTRWELRTIDGAPIEPALLLELRGAPFVQFLISDALTGFGSCNGFGGNYTLRTGTIAFANLEITGVECDSSVMALETLFVGFLRDTVTVAIDGNRLTLTATDGRSLQFEGATGGDPGQLLVGTVWTVETINGRGEAGYAAYTLRFLDDGTFTLTDGCGNASGRFSRSGFEMRFSSLDAVPANCPDAARGDDQRLRQALTLTNNFRIEGGTLLLSAGNQSTMTLRAAPRTTRAAR